VLISQIRLDLVLSGKEGQGDTRPAELQCNGCLRRVTVA